MNLTLNLLSGLLTLIANIPYIISILKGKTKPNRATWWIWCGVDLILAFTYQETGATAALGLAYGSLLGVLIIAVLSLRYGVQGMTTLDYVCLLSAIGTAVLWLTTSSPFLPHFLIVCIDFFGWLPTFQKTLNDPGSEEPLAWMLWVCGAFVALLNIDLFTFWNMFFPLYIVISDGTIAVLTTRYRYRLRRSAH